ncbi:MAG: hypothetical protein ACI906_002017 [Candidatus Latescibacterota bacterium]|jgi:hypothetical protein
MNPVLDLSERLSVLPIIYGSGDFAIEVRRRLLSMRPDCVAVALPASFADAVESGIERLPVISAVVQREITLESEYNYVPIDPCQGIIAAVRTAMDMEVDRAFIDLEVESYEEQELVLPDPYALKEVAFEKFLAALLPALPPPLMGEQRQERIRRMAYELHRLELEYERVAFVCSVADWPWVRQAYAERAPYIDHQRTGTLPECRRVAADCLYFALGELPYITHLYEYRRAEMVADASLAVDGVKALLIEARDLWAASLELEDGHWLAPQQMGLLLKYVRNLTLLDRRLTPDLYNLALAAKQVGGDDYALVLLDLACDYPPQRMVEDDEEMGMGIGKIIDEDGRPQPCKNRLQGVSRIWRKLPLKPNPPAPQKQKWGQEWDPYGQCSYPLEDQRIESFQQHVREQARILVGEDLAKVEKFSSSLKDGLDIRETLRNWHTGDLYVKETPPSRGHIEVVVFLFDVPADPRRYTWQSTWYAEHAEESTLSFFATPFIDNMVGPGIGQALYGGCSFIFPPRPIADIWHDENLSFAQSLEERLLAGALMHSQEKRVVLVSPQPPGVRWRRMARKLGRQIVYIPIKRFSAPTIDRLRRFHVLNSKEVRSYAARFIRDIR